MGYSRAGFEVVGVDIKPQPHYPFEFHQADALDVLKDSGLSEDFDAIHASPPCQAYTNAQRIRGREHPDLIGPVRELLHAIGLSYVIENVPGAPLRDPTLLCGAMFSLGVYRHRLFETSFPLPFSIHAHGQRQAKMGRRSGPDEVIQVVGHFADVGTARRAMGIDWMTRDELAQAIPPAYTEWIGRQLIEAIR
jgi:DNA (cytosine-5)-methyltransferase 1